MNLYRDAFIHIRQFTTAFWTVIAASFINQTGNMAIVFLVLYLNQGLGYSLSLASFGFATMSFSMLLTGLFGGSLVDKLGPGRVMVVSIFANGITLLTFTLISHYVTIILFCFTWGFTYGLYRPASLTLVGHLSTKGQHKLTFSLYRLVLNLGMSVGPALGGYLAYHSYKAIFIANGIANILAGLILLWGLARTPWLTYRAEKSKGIHLNLRWLKKDANLRLFMLGMIPVSMVFFQHESTLAVFLKQDMHYPLTFYGFLFTINTLIIVFVELLLNIATMNWPYRVNFMLGSFFITIAFTGLAFVSQPWQIIVLAITWTVGEMILYPSSNSYVADIAPKEHLGSYMSLFSTTSNLGMLFGPWAGAYVMQKLGSNGLWLACGAWGFLSLLTFYRLREVNKSTTPELTAINLS